MVSSIEMIYMISYIQYHKTVIINNAFLIYTPYRFILLKIILRILN